MRKVNAKKPVAEELRNFKVQGILVTMAEHGQLLAMRCEMPTCDCPKGRETFDVVGTMPDRWIPTEDHFPTLKSKSKGNPKVPSNIRLGHKHCNNADQGRRRQIADMLDQGLSLVTIAERLKAKGVTRSDGRTNWTPAAVRKALVT
jgi:hypothetical protein